MTTLSPDQKPLSKIKKKSIPGIFDTDVHASVRQGVTLDYLPKRFRDAYRYKSKKHGILNFDKRGGGARADIDPAGVFCSKTIREVILDPYEIQLALITGTDYDDSCYADLELCSAVASANNTAYIENLVSQDPPFLGCNRINMNDPDAAVSEIERWAKNPRVAAIITSTASAETPGSKRYDPIFRAAENANLVIAYHTTQEGRGVTPPPSSAGYPSRYIEYHSGLATSVIGHAASLITNGVFANFPKLRVIYLEGGICWSLPLMWQLDAEWEQLRDEYPHLPEPPSHYLKNHIHFTTQPIEEPRRGRDLLLTYQQIGLDRNITFSTDYPHWDFDDPNFFLPQCFQESMRDDILWNNAANLFRERIPNIISEIENTQ